MEQSGDGLPRRRRSIRSTGCSSNQIHGIAQEYAKSQKASKFFQDEKERTAVECMVHKTGVSSYKRKHRWSAEEDKILLEMVNLHGSKNWSTIARAMPGLSGNQCRDRWIYSLDPALNRHAWSEQEEIALIRAHQIHGNKWSELAKLFPGRTGKALQNHWNCGIKRRLNSYLTRGLLDGKSSESVSTKGFFGRSSDDLQVVVCQMDTSKSPVVTNKKMALSSSSVDLKVCDAAPSFVRSVSEEKQMSSSCPPEALPSCANTVLYPAHSSQSTDGHFDEIYRGADKELTELHQADIADLLDMSYCASLMIIPPDSPHHI